ncbi:MULTISPECIES: DedA family protein [unclassified Paenibacillus]|uniref:DedA family protein n=1 Tax=unclassified Paenibacillus TaxID=185978 RepID=UPI0024049F67|nr:MULTISPECIES: DedA family protein [unclassified Paenibacillus]MDF9840556.1 membrane protein DedA with SNARE-associated domain [Paenibacillus sp. PastF-2]MDF9847138.1 membrane protein DedA with SNARE-associated domain [Paenibacillus sp. PastM-2]MDF9853710.1 membrane protein DedA with SNARE-associated domain [Paenibacillus sp. PastF-1]MDH6478804.1 membrane protein DedA with SNARE-associated domain [Paenibacillus sp. PastH-2]MDH6506536.1 membrane protein DedA with SNARE-associated domain [Paen
MKTWITDFMEQFGYLGIMLMLAFENIFPPIPSEIILPFGGFMTTTTEMTIPGVLIAATVGSLLGAVVLYWVGRLLDVSRLEKIVERWGGWLRISAKDIRRADAWFDKYGYWTVLFCRMIPLVRSLISIPAGMSGMKFGQFMLFTTIGTLGWNTLLILLGAALGESWEDIAHYMDAYSNVVYALLAAGILVLGVLFFRRRQAAGKARS